MLILGELYYCKRVNPGVAPTHLSFEQPGKSCSFTKGNLHSTTHQLEIEIVLRLFQKIGQMWALTFVETTGSWNRLSAGNLKCV